MSGPVTTDDEAPAEGGCGDTRRELEVTDPHEARVGRFTVRRALPRRTRRTVGSWCFVDLMGPAQVTEEHGLDVAPHPHIGLQTVTWLLAGEGLHRDSLGTEQVIAPGQLNLMTAGRGIAHSEEATGRYAGPLQGVQLWVAQPEETRHGDPAFEHHGELPQVELGSTLATVLVGDLAGTASPARRDTDHLGADLQVRTGTTVLPLQRLHEHALVVVEGSVTVGGTPVSEGQLAYLGVDHDEVPVEAREPARAMLLGGVPLEDRLVMWWNYVARSQDEVSDAHRAWTAGATDRFGSVASPLERLVPDPPPWDRG
ncbi:MAG TPA: pirin family protein [Acidimicrobiales bacterium]|nr:pirin family protein [Acidimicrobiales bacterium]